MEIRLLDVAQRELDQWVEYYNAEFTGYGDQFLLEVLYAFERIKFQAQVHSEPPWRELHKVRDQYTQSTRRSPTRRLPFGIVYQIIESDILIVAIAHLYRRPGHIGERD